MTEPVGDPGADQRKAALLWGGNRRRSWGLHHEASGLVARAAGVVDRCTGGRYLAGPARHDRVPHELALLPAPQRPSCISRSTRWGMRQRSQVATHDGRSRTSIADAVITLSSCNEPSTVTTVMRRATGSLSSHVVTASTSVIDRRSSPVSGCWTPMDVAPGSVCRLSVRCAIVPNFPRGCTWFARANNGTNTPCPSASRVRIGSPPGRGVESSFTKVVFASWHRRNLNSITS